MQLLIGSHGRLSALFFMNEITVQYVVMTAHQPQGDPVADRQHNDTNNTNL